MWRRTILNRERLTSAIELYDRSGTLVSRFGLNFPEYQRAAQESRSSTSCQWSPLFGEAQPFGAEERNMLHAERGICDDGEVVGTIVVHVMLDYRNLLFISSQSPYFELFRSSESRAPGEGMPGSDVDVTIYGWGLHADLQLGARSRGRSTRRSSSGSTTGTAPRSGPTSRAATSTTTSTSPTIASSSTRSATRR